MQLSDVPEGYELAQVQMSASENYPLEKGNLLSSRGDVDVYMIGRRLATRYSQFLDKYPYDASRYDIRGSAVPRCTQSAHGFATGLFEGRYTKDPRDPTMHQDTMADMVEAAEALGTIGGRVDDQNASKKRRPALAFPPIQPVHIYTIPKGLDKELAVKYSCPKWLSVVAKHPLVSQHEDMYIQDHIQPIADRLTQLFFPKGPNNGNHGSSDDYVDDDNDGSIRQRMAITVEDVQLIYQMCGYEMAFYDDHETWCQLLWRPRQPSSRPHRSVGTETERQSMSDDHNTDGGDGDDSDREDDGEEESWSMADPIDAESKGHRRRRRHDDRDYLGRDFLHLEYLSDLGDYYSYGPGVPFNQHLARPLSRALIDSVEKILAAESNTPSLARASGTPDQSTFSPSSPTLPSHNSTVSGLTAVGQKRAWSQEGNGGYSMTKSGRADWLSRDPEDEDDSAHHAVLKFGHSETIMFWSTFLGLYGEKKPLRGDQSGLKKGDRAFRASDFSPFAANMVLEVYRPLVKDLRGDDHDDDNDDDHQGGPNKVLVSKQKSKEGRDALVRLLVNEEPRTIPGCSSSGSDDSQSAMGGHDVSMFCRWSDFRAMLIARGADQEFEGCCGIERDPPNGTQSRSSACFSRGGRSGSSSGGAEEDEEPCLSTEPLPLVR
ncbi:hypothetical protein DFQ26_007017 [Actinomortierella ambigua]|nr:hypothetical protein DFQ26_007017 [Actinomortierella ambigua]